MSNIKDERVKEIAGFYVMNGEQKTVDTYNISLESLNRYLRKAKKFGFDRKAVNLAKIADMYTDSELKVLTKGKTGMVGNKVNVHDFDGEVYRIGFGTDPHLGSKYTNPDHVKQMFDEFDRSKVDSVMLTGDISEGLSNRAGHVYECTHVGYDAQKEHSIDVLSQWVDTPMYLIDGNHDRWYHKTNGALIVKDICEALPNAEFIGHDEGDIMVNGVKIKLWHGEDSSSYAISYRLQKLIESFSGGEKPHLLLTGHTHKMGYFQIRNVHCVSGGSIQMQSKWMRGKKIAAHTGFWIIEVVINDSGIGRLKTEWFPFYA